MLAEVSATQEPQWDSSAHFLLTFSYQACMSCTPPFMWRASQTTRLLQYQKTEWEVAPEGKVDTAYLILSTWARRKCDVIWTVLSVTGQIWKELQTTRKETSFPLLEAMDTILPTLMILFHHQQSIYPQEAVHILVRLRCSTNFTLLKVCCYSGQVCLFSEKGKIKYLK